jgi:hypothetical protein
VGIPDVPQAVLGFRVWSTDAAQETLRAVVAVGGDYDWPVGQLENARCPLLKDVGPEDYGWHRTPDPNCGCGIYLARNIKTISRYFSRPAVKVCGLAMGWGGDPRRVHVPRRARHPGRHLPSDP